MPRAGPRLVPIAVAAVLLAVRLVAVPPAWGTTAGYALAGFGLLAVAAAVHLLALRRPDRPAIEGTAWVATVVAAVVLVVLLIPAGGR